jgi:hypothetical protein
MATPTENPDFIMFVNFMGVDLSMDNMTIFTNLFVNFTGFIPQYPCNTLAEKFILWKRFYDDYSAQQHQLQNNNTFNMAPKDPRHLKPQVKIESKLADLNNDDNYVFQNFTFQTTKPDEPQTSEHNLSPAYEMDNLEVLQESTTLSPKIITTSHDSQRPPPPPYKSPVGDVITTTATNADPAVIAVATIHTPPKPHQGKSLQQMKQILAENKPQRPTPKKRKRKPEPVEEEEEAEEEERVGPTVTIPPGRPTKDHALIRDANRDAKNEDSGNDDDSPYGLVDVQLLSATGAIRKKMKLLTKNEGEIKCFSIRHYASLEYIAEKKKKAFNNIKKQRQTLKKLNYLEQNTLKDIKEVKSLYHV